MSHTVESLICNIPLKEMDGVLLATTIRSEVRRAGWSLRDVEAAIEIAAWAHRSQTRANRGVMPRTHYIEHPLRNAARLLRWGCNDAAIIVAAILHDVIEDCSLVIAHDLLGLQPANEADARAATADFYIARRFGWRVRDLVDGLTNPLVPAELPRERKNYQYIKHVIAAIEDPGVCLAKVADVTDNASGLHHNLAGEDSFRLVQYLATKYSPLFVPLLARVERPDVAALLSYTGWSEMQASLVRGQGRIVKLLAA